MDRKRITGIQAVIFDMDGVLIDSEPLWRKAEIETFNELGFDFTDEMCRQTMGMRTREVVEYWQRILQWQQPSVEVVTDSLLQKIHYYVEQEGKALPGVYELIQFFSQRKLPLAVASSSPASLIDLVLTKLDIARFFQVVESAEHLPYGKPHPQIFLNAAKRLATAPSNCLVIEDSFHGMIAAKAAQMTTIVVPEKEKYETGNWCIADAKCASLQQVQELFTAD